MKLIKIIFYVNLIVGFNFIYSQEDKQTALKNLQTSLFQPIIVTIGDNFIVTESFSAFRTQGLDHFITNLYNQTQEKVIVSIFTNLPVLLKTIDELKMLRSANLTIDEFEYSFLYDTYLRFINNKSLIDFIRISNNKTKDGSYIVNDGEIIIPKRQNIVYVFSQVVNQGFYIYNSSKT
ncbi:MAG: hypothetical protein NUV92_06840 [Ignavibacteria bacterium]|jgi:hypothetical protein|nr:hypothetical protein [Ignavibacteria bacterium]MDH7527393.1 hypothetical protein [Ignavibacteria bacterium]